MYERHKGDNILSEDPRLKHKWEWSRVASGVPEEELVNWTHFQVSESHFGYWTMSAIQWGEDPVYYEATIEYRGDRMTLGSAEEIKAETRIEAQIKAEKMLVDWITEAKELFNNWIANEEAALKENLTRLTIGG